MVRVISLQVDELELIFRAISVLESKQAVRRWFNGIVSALRARPIDLCQSARGRRAVLRELGRIKRGVHS
ncbi:MAG: antitoxin Xre/MbcA/ParS toxin-binding domain-containing protein [Limisphaerales bacterium]